jgi:hypothetical protein
MTHFRKFYDAKYVGSWDLPDKDTVVTITKVVGEELTSVGGRTNKKPVLYMKGTEKGLALNKTNSKAIAGMYGVQIEDWIGKRISLYKSTTRAPDGSGDVECIRVRPQIPKRAYTTSAGEPADAGIGDAGTAAAEDEPQITIAAAIASLDKYADIDTLSLYADDLPNDIKTDFAFTKAFRARYDELKVK